jgi:hypothetical protein
MRNRRDIVTWAWPRAVGACSRPSRLTLRSSGGYAPRARWLVAKAEHGRLPPYGGHLAEKANKMLRNR